MKYLLMCLVLLLPTLASAQTPNPARFRVQFTSIDHAAFARYDAGFFLQGAAEPIQSGIASLGLPGPDPNGVIVVLIDARPLTVGQYDLRVRGVQIANGATFVTAWSNPVPFDRALLPPENLQRAP